MKPYQILLLTLICLHSSSQAAVHEQTSYVNPAATVDLRECAKADSDCLAKKKNIVSTAMQISLEAIYVENEQASVDRFKRQNEHQAAALWAQYYQSWIICFTVFMIISTGLLMSWKHMTEGFRTGVSVENALEVGRDGVKLKSPVIGLIIFAISTYFFGVYVDKVYTVNLFAADAVKKNTADKPEDKKSE